MTQTVNPLKQFFRQPAIYLSLPSGGHHWPATALTMPENREFPVYPMTAIDEITYRTPDALFSGQAVINVIHSCLPNIKNAWEVPGVDLNAILIAIRIASYGHEMELATKCPKCETESDFGIDLRMVLDSIREPDYGTPIQHGDLEITLMPVSYRNQNQVGLKQYEQQRNVQQIQSDTSTSDEEKIKRLNEIMHLITEITIETLKYSIASIRTPDALVTEIDFIRDFLVNCDRKLYQEIRDRVIELRTSSDLKPFEVVCPNCSHKHEQTLTLDQAAFFGVAS
jgi:hypothetical protein